MTSSVQMRCKYHNVAICLAMLLIAASLSGCSMTYNMLMKPKPLPFDFSKTEEIEVYSDQTYQEGTPLLVVDKPEDIGEIAAMLRQVKGGYEDTPACSLGIWMVCRSKDARIDLKIGTDDCGTVLHNKLDYSMGSDNFVKLRDILIRLGVDVRDYAG